MRSINKCLLGVLLCASVSASAKGQSNLPTMEEALAISQKSGRPILAMAGTKT